VSGPLLFDEKIRQSAALFWFGLREQLLTLPHFWSTVRRKAGGWINFYMKRFRTFKFFQISKTKLKKSKTFNGG
jgi:hypothetical protein